MSNAHVSPTNSHYNRVCGAVHPRDSNWVCSLSENHRSDKHRAYWDHKNDSRTRLYDSWPNRSLRGKVAQDDVAAALASIQATMQSRAPKGGNGKKPDVSVTVRIGVQSDTKAELDDIIQRLTVLRDSLP